MTPRSPKYYVPNTHNIPFLRERGDVSVTLAAGSLGEIQAAHGIGSNVGLMFNGAIARPKDDADGGQGNFAELEPAATLRFGAEYLKVQIQVGSSENLTNSDFRQDDGHASLGIIFYPTRSRQSPSR